MLSTAVEQTAPRTVIGHAGPSVAGEVAAAAEAAHAEATAEAAKAAAAAVATEAGPEAAEAAGGASASSPPGQPTPEAADAAAPEGAEGAEGAEARPASPSPYPAESMAEESGVLLTPARRASEAAASGAEALSPPHGVGCLHEVLRFLVLLVDPNEPQNPQAVREFGLALLHVALQAGGPALANVPALSSLLSHDLALGLIMNAEACGSIGTEEGEVGVAFAWRAKHQLLSLVLMCCYQLFLVLGVQGTLQEETLVHRVYLKLLNNKSLMEGREMRDQREMLMEMLLQLCELPQLPLRLYTHFDCDKRRTDLLEDLTKAISKAAFPVAGPPDVAHLLSVEALHAILRSTCGEPTAAAAAAAAAAASTITTSTITTPPPPPRLLHLRASGAAPGERAAGLARRRLVRRPLEW